MYRELSGFYVSPFSVNFVLSGSYGKDIAANQNPEGCTLRVKCMKLLACQFLIPFFCIYKRNHCGNTCRKAKPAAEKP